MQVPTVSNLPMTDTQSLHTTNLKFRMLTLPNLAPISCVVDSAIDQLNNFFSIRPQGFFLFEQKSDQLFVCLQVKEEKRNAVKRVAISIDSDGVAALFSVKGEEKRELFQDFAKRLGLNETENLAEKRAYALSKLNLRYAYADVTLDLMLTPCESYLKNIVEIEVEKPTKARHTFMLLGDTLIRGHLDRNANIYKAMYPILVCVDSTLNKQELDQLFCENAEEGQCYVRFSEPGSNKMTLVTTKIKIPLSFSVMTSSTGNHWLNWTGQMMNLPQILFNNRAYGINSTAPSLFGE